jgi:high-affinity iron transporter
VLIVIAAGVLSYGLRDLQEGGVLPGGHAYAFDLSGSLDAGSWYATLVQGVLNITVTMTWLQVVAYVAYLAVVMTLFVRGVRASAPKAEKEPVAAVEQDAPTRNRWLLPAALVTAPAVVAGVVIAASDGKPAAAATVTVSDDKAQCGKGFTTPQPGRQTFQMHNAGSKTSEVYLVNPATNAVYGEIEGLAPGTTRPLTATIGSGDLAWRCVPTGGDAVTSAAVHVVGGPGGADANAVLPVSEDDLGGPLGQYKSYVNGGLTELLALTQKLQSDVHGGDLAAARADWLTAHLEYSSLGAAYGTFADLDKKINGRADGLPDGVNDKDFSGFHRVEYGLWHNQSADELTPAADQLTSDVAELGKEFPTQPFDPGDLPLRTHEILENTLQFELTGDTDEGSGTNLATAEANLAGTRELLTLLQPLIQQRSPQLLDTVNAGMKRVGDLLAGAHRPDGSWTPVQQLDQPTRTRLNGATGQLLEDLAPIPDLLEIRKSA